VRPLFKAPREDGSLVLRGTGLQLIKVHQSSLNKDMTTLYLRKSIGRSPLGLGLLLISLLLPWFALSSRARANPGDLYGTAGESILIYTPIPPYGITVLADVGNVRPRGLAFDKFGNLFGSTLDTTDLGDDQGRILKFNADGTFNTFPLIFPTGKSALDNPQQIVFDSAGNLFVPNAGGGNSGLGQPACTVSKIAPDRRVTTFATIGNDNNPNGHQLFGAAFDVHDNLFIADFTAHTIYKITPGEVVSPFAMLNTGPVGLAFDSTGSLLVSTFGAAGLIIKISPDGTQQTPFATISSDANLRGLAFDAQGNLFVAGRGTGTVYKVVPDGTWSATNFPGSQWLAFDPRVVADTPTSQNPVTANVGTVGFATIALTFPNVTMSGTTTVTPIYPRSAGTLPSGFELVGGNLAFEITTTATYSTATSPMIIAFQVPSVDAATFSQLRVLHNEGGTLVDVTASDPAPNPTTQTIYASVSSLSPFVIAKETLNAQVKQPINPDGSSVFSVKRGVVPVTFTLTSNGVATCQLPRATISLTRTAGTAVGSIDEGTYLLASDGGSNFRIRDCQYGYNLATKSLGAGTYTVNILIGGSIVGNGTFSLK
jgi:hypothetical protein